jgi:hypothetical protein
LACDFDAGDPVTPAAAPEGFAAGCGKAVASFTGAALGAELGEAFGTGLGTGLGIGFGAGFEGAV